MRLQVYRHSPHFSFDPTIQMFEFSDDAYQKFSEAGEQPSSNAVRRRPKLGSLNMAKSLQLGGDDIRRLGLLLNQGAERILVSGLHNLLRLGFIKQVRGGFLATELGARIYANQLLKPTK